MSTIKSFTPKLLGLLILASVLISSAAWAAGLKLTGQIKGTTGGGYSILLVSKSGKVLGNAALPASGKFSIKGVSAKNLKGASLQLTNSGQYVGPVVLKASGSKDNIFFSGKVSGNAKAVALGAIPLKTGYGLVKKVSDAAIVNVKTKASASAGAPIGAAKLGFVTASASAEGKAGEDDDHDGIINVYDVDRDGDLLANSFDVLQSSQSSSRLKAGILANGQSGGLDTPFTTLYLGMNNTLNVNVGGVTRTQIDSVISGNGSFAIVYFFAAESTYTGAHIVCDSSLAYCRSAADGGSTSTVGGVSESTSPPSGQWSAFNDDGSGYPNLDLIPNFHGDGSSVFVASVNPGVGTSGFHPGDVATIEFMTGSVVSERRPITIPSYFVTVPALASYDVGAGVQTINYSSPPGVITLPSGQNFTGTFWRPQRLALGSESGEFMDISALHYGVVISTQVQEFGCAATYYSGLSSLTPEGSQNLWPLIDTSTVDSVPASSNTLGFTLDLRACILANGGSVGQAYQVSLTAAGAQETGGNDRAAQNFYVMVQ